MTNAVQTRAVLAGAYKGKRQNLKDLLTHSVEVTADGFEVKVLGACVKLENICDELGSDSSAPPTCPRCLKKNPRFQP